MAALPALLDFDITFDIPNLEVSITDNTDYTGVTGTLTKTYKVTDPTGTIYQSTSSHPGTPSAIALPTLIGGDVIPGVYNFELKVSDSATLTEIISDFDYNFQYIKPTVTVDLSVDCIYPLLTSEDNTDYNIGGINPTTLTRTHTLQYPPSTGESDYVVSTETLQTNTVYTLKSQPLQHSATVTSDVEYTLSSNVFLIDTLEGTGYIDVICDNELCDVYCALKCKWNDYNKQKCLNKTLAESHLEDFILMTSYAQMIQSAMRCGKGDDIVKYTTAIKDLSNCDSCGCDDGDPILITGLGGGVFGKGNTYVVASGGAPVVVTANTVGTTTTYTVSLDSLTITKINSLRNSIVTAGTNTSVSSSTALDGTITYEVSSIAGASDSLSLIITADNTTLNTIPVLTASDIETIGTTFDPLPSLSWLSYQPVFPDTYTTSPSVPQFTGGTVSIILSDIFATPYLGTPKIHVQKLKVYRNYTNAPTFTQDSLYKNIEDYLTFEVYYKDGEVKISPIYTVSGFNYRNGDNFVRTTATLPGSFDPFDHRNFYFQIAVTITI